MMLWKVQMRMDKLDPIQVEREELGHHTMEKWDGMSMEWIRKRRTGRNCMIGLQLEVSHSFPNLGDELIPVEESSAIVSEGESSSRSVAWSPSGLSDLGR